MQGISDDVTALWGNISSETWLRSRVLLSLPCSNPSDDSNLKRSEVG